MRIEKYGMVEYIYHYLYEIPDELANPSTPNLAKISFSTEPVIGSRNSYLSDCLDTEHLLHLASGDSILIASAVGSGKTTAITQAIPKLAESHPVIYVVNRKACVRQVRQALLRQYGFRSDDWPEDAILNYSFRNITILTYQSFVKTHQYFQKDTVLVLDEIQYLLCDATFSKEPMRVKELLHKNIEETIRIYISGTMEPVVPVLYDIEREDNTPFTAVQMDYQHYARTHIRRLYYMEASWEHLAFRFYRYTDIDRLADYLNQQAADGHKSLICVRSKERGRQLSEKLHDSQFICSSEEEVQKELLSDLVRTEQAVSSSLVTTKVLENGVSITDDSIDTIVIEETDPVSFLQFLGRVRTSRKKPRKLTVLIPDYTAGELNTVRHQCTEKLERIRFISDNKEKCMEDYEEYMPYLYYTDSTPKVNMLARQQLQTQTEQLSACMLEEAETPHAHIRYLLRMLELPDTITDQQFLHYDDIAAFRNGVRDAWQTFQDSQRRKSDRDQLAKALIEVVNRTNSGISKISSAQIQIKKINEILAVAHIPYQITSLGETFGIESHPLSIV